MSAAPVATRRDGSVAMIADRATELAEQFIEGGRQELAAMCADDQELLFQAAQLVRSRSVSQARRAAANPEHVAFSLLIAANDLLRERVGPREGAPRRV